MEIAHGVRTIEIVRQLAPHLDAEAEVVRLEKMEADDQEGVVGHARRGRTAQVDSRRPLVRGDFRHPLSGDLHG